jgi:hypothetical protein
MAWDRLEGEVEPKTQVHEPTANLGHPRLNPQPGTRGADEFGYFFAFFFGGFVVFCFVVGLFFSFGRVFW